MKKRIVCAMMCVAMVATSLVGCGSSTDEGTADDAATETTDDGATDTGRKHGYAFLEIEEV